MLAGPGRAENRHESRQRSVATSGNLSSLAMCEGRRLDTWLCSRRARMEFGGAALGPKANSNP